MSGTLTSYTKFRQETFIKGMNFFGRKRFSPLALFSQNDGVIRLVECQLEQVISEHGSHFDVIRDICLGTAQSFIEGKLTSLDRAELEAESNLQSIFANQGQSVLKETLLDRSQLLNRQISELLKIHGPKNRNNSAVLDLGCGDGLVSLALNRSTVEDVHLKEFTVADVRDYRSNRVKTRFDWTLLPERYHHLPIKKRFDVVLLITVLHHALHPLEVLEAAIKNLRPGGILVVCESCVDVRPSALNRYDGLFRRSGYEGNHLMEDYLALSEDQQMIYGIFTDWFYNRVLHQDDVPVPYNFHSPHGWADIFRNLPDVDKVFNFAEGFDQKSVPEFHTFHLISKKA